jgi:Bacterial Ig-like domain
MSRLVCAHAFVLAMSTAAMAGCSDEGNESELDSEGPPRVTVVTVSAGGGEVPAYCVGPEADKISVVCLDANGDYAFDGTQPVETSPGGWQVRLVFNELLDPDRAEELVVVRDPNNPGEPERDQYGNPVLRGTLVSSQPVTLTCNGAPIAYDGYYNPSGNHLSVPPGPSLVVQALEVAPTSATCQVEVVQGQSAPGFGVFDKRGNPVSAPDRGPFTFRTEALAIAGVSPASDLEGVALDIAPLVSFNAPLDPDTLSVDGLGRVRLRTAPEGEVDGVDVEATLAVEGGNSVRLTPAAALSPQTRYELVVYSGIADAAGGPPLALDTEPAVQSTFTTGD